MIGAPRPRGEPRIYPGGMSDKSDGLGDNIWILIPLAALSIPIFAVIGNSTILTTTVAGVVGLLAVTMAIRSLLTHRHRLRMEELEAQERIVRAEREHLTAAERLLEMDEGLGDLNDAVRKPNDPETT